MTDPKPTFPYVEFQMVKKDGTGNKRIETQYLNCRSCHGNAETLQQMVRAGKKLISYGNLDKLAAENRNEIANFVDGVTGVRLDPLFKAPSVMEERVERARKERPTNA